MPAALPRVHDVRFSIAFKPDLDCFSSRNYGRLSKNICNATGASSGDWSVQRFEERFGEPILDVRPAYAPSMVAPLLERYGDNGRAAYLAFLRMDMLFLLIYGAAFSGLLSLLGRRRERLSCLNLLPLGIALSDALENGFTAVQLAGYPQPFPWLAWGGALSSLSKNALTLGTLVVLSVWAAQAVRRRRAS